MPSSLPGALLAALLGALAAFLNYTIARKAALPGEDRPASLPAGAVPVIRMTLNVGVLVLVYFAAPHTPWDRTWMLVGAVVGLTLPLLVFTPLLLREADRQAQERAKRNRASETAESAAEAEDRSGTAENGTEINENTPAGANEKPADEYQEDPEITNTKGGGPHG